MINFVCFSERLVVVTPTRLSSSQADLLPPFANATGDKPQIDPVKLCLQGTTGGGGLLNDQNIQVVMAVGERILENYKLT